MYKKVTHLLVYGDHELGPPTSHLSFYLSGLKQTIFMDVTKFLGCVLGSFGCR
jgi:hypothetical protein